MTSPEPQPPMNMLMVALWWARKDVPVLPLHYPLDGVCSCGRSNCDNPAKHPIANLTPHGLNDATTDVEVIRDWWAQYPYANIGVRTGVVFDLIDIDSAQGAATFEKLRAEHGMPANLGIAQSGRAEGGMHIYTVAGGQKALHGGKTSPPGIDVKGRGGYAVVAPSIHISGRRYEWVDNRFDNGDIVGDATWEAFYQALIVKPQRAPAAPRPTTEIHRDAADAYGRAVLARASGLVLGAGKGHRWQTLATEAVPLVARGIEGGCIDRDGGIRELEDAARKAGLGSAEVDRINALVDNMLSAGITHPIRPKDAAEHADVTVIYQTESEARADPWDPPWPLRHPTPPFPLEVMGWMEKPIRDLSEQLQVPTDLTAMMTIAAVSATIRGRIRGAAIPGWEEPLNLYIAAVLGPGETKSPALARIVAPLREMEKEARKKAKEVILERQFAKDLADDRAKRLRDDALKAKGNPHEVAMARQEAWQAAEEADQLTVPTMPLWLAGDMTPEALVTKLAEQNGALAHLSAEGELLDTIVGGRYSSGAPHLSSLLTAHDGREPVRVHRKHAADIEVQNPCLTLGLAVQPQVLEQLGQVDAAVRRGLGARFLYSVPTSLVGRRDMTLSRGSEDIEGFEALLKGVEAIARRGGTPAPWDHPNATRSEDIEATNSGWRIQGSTLQDPSSEDIEDKSLKCLFSKSSLSLFLHYREALEPRRAAQTGDLGEISAWANKLDGHLIRLASVLQLIRDVESEPLTHGSWPQNPQNQEREVGPDAVASALVLGDYLIAHAVEAHALMSNTSAVDNDAQQLLGWLQQHGEPEFTVRDAQQSLRRRATFREPESVHSACTTLERLGWIRRLPADPGPGRPSIRYLVHPEVHQ